MSKLRIDAIVAIALDDLEQGHTDLPTMLHLLASLAWQEGRDEARHHQHADAAVPYPAPPREDSSSPHVVPVA
jgi:hypothetical protein